MPEIEAEQQKRDADQEAYDNLMDCLSNKTTEEINALTKQLKQAGTGRKKGNDIDQINQILNSWPKERVSFLAESLKHQQDGSQEAKEQAKPEESETQEQPEQEERKKRDRLTGQAKVDYLVSQLTEECQFMSPSFQREVLMLVAKGTLSPPDWKATHDDKIYKVGKINKFFEKCSNRIRQKVIAQYLRDVMPTLEIEHEEREADQEATEELLALTEGKTPKQIRDMTALLKNSKLTS